MTKKWLAAFTAFCLLMVCPLYGKSAEPSKVEDYEALLNDAEQMLAEDPEGTFEMLYPAYTDDISAFIAVIGFREAKLQQAVVDLFCSEASREQLVVLQETSDSYLFGFYNNGKTVYDHLTKSEASVLFVFQKSIAYKLQSLPLPYAYRTDYKTLFAELLQASEGTAEGYGQMCVDSLKEEADPFIKALAEESEENQIRIIGVMQVLASTSRGVVVADMLDGLDTSVFNEGEKATLEALKKIFEGVQRPPCATGPDPEELAARNAHKEGESTHPTEPQPPETGPEPTQTQPPETKPEPTQTKPNATEPEPTEPMSAEQKPQGITGWVILPVFLIALAAVGVFAVKRKPH